MTITTAEITRRLLVMQANLLDINKELTKILDDLQNERNENENVDV